jgi:hypothetical protein
MARSMAAPGETQLEGASAVISILGMTDGSSASAAGRDQDEQQAQRPFFSSFYWLILKNVIGWLLILAALVAGPLVPGPGGIPLFLIGFALISFRGKRRLTARVLRGKPIRLNSKIFALVSVAIGFAAPAILLAIAHTRSRWRAGLWVGGSGGLVLIYAASVMLALLALRASPFAVNVLLRIVPRMRRRVRPWLRRHRIRLLPPRYRRAHETHGGVYRLKEEILGWSRRR